MPLSLVLLFATTAAVAAASGQYTQPILPLLAHDFGIAPKFAASIPMLVQLGCAAGVLFLAPLGDKLNRKRLIGLCMCGLIAAQIAASSAATFPVFLVASFAVGLFGSMSQQIVPMAAHLAPPADRGRVIGAVMSGVVLGLLFARTFSGVMADIVGWRMVLALAALSVAAVGLVLEIVLTDVEAATSLSYPKLITSLWHLFAAHRTLRLAAAVQFCALAAYNVVWTEIALHLHAPPMGWSSTSIGFMTLFGLAGVIVGPVAGSCYNPNTGRLAVLWALGSIIAGFGVLAVAGSSPLYLGAGIVLVDAGVQVSQVINQTRVQALDPRARSRLNTVLMAIVMLGGAAGAGLGGFANALFGWSGVCSLGATFGVIALGLTLRASAK